MEFEIGQKVELENYTEAAISCNASGDRHIEQINNEFVIVANTEPTELSIDEKVAMLEKQTGLTRPLREIILSENSASSEYVKQKAQEIEQMAQVLRLSDDQKEIQEAIDAETVVNLMEK